MKRNLFLILWLSCLMFMSCEQSGYITGTVKDVVGRPLEGVTVKIKNSQIETTTDAKGTYRINYIPGNFTLIFAKEGYTSFELPLDLLVKEKYPAEEVVLAKLPKDFGLYLYDSLGRPIQVQPVNVGLAEAEFDRESDILIGIKDLPMAVTPEAKPKFLLYGNEFSVENLSLNRLTSWKKVNVFWDYLAEIGKQKRQKFSELNIWADAEKIPFTWKKYPGEVQEIFLTPKTVLSPGGYAIHCGTLFTGVSSSRIWMDRFFKRALELKVAYFFEVDNGLYAFVSRLWALPRNDQFDKLKSEIAKGANVNSATPITGRTPLMAAVAGNDREMALFFLKNGAEVNQRNKWGTSAFLYAVANNSMDMIKMLIEYKANLNAKYNDGSIDGLTALHLAAGLGHSEIAKFLIDHGLDVNVKAQYGLTPLHNASYKGHVEIVKLLVGKGADVNARMKNGKTAADLAKEKGHSQVLKVLQEKMRGGDLGEL